MSRQNSIPDALYERLRREAIVDRHTDTDTMILWRHCDEQGNTEGWVVTFRARDTETQVNFWYSTAEFQTAIDHYNQD